MLESIPVIVLGVGAVITLGIVISGGRRWIGTKKGDVLDRAIFRWDDENTLTIRNLLAGGIHVFGRTDAGKSSSMKQVGRAILEQDSALLVLCSKNGEYREWLGMAMAAGREKDVVLIDPKHDFRFNMIGYCGAGAGGVEGVVRFVMEMRNSIFREGQSVGGESAMWKKYDETAIRNAAILLITAGEEVTATNMHNLITSAPVSLSEMKAAEWQAGYCNHVIREGFDMKKSNVQTFDFEQAREYFTRVWPAMGDRTRGSVLMGVSGTLNAMNIGLAREMFGSGTNITPREAIEGKKIVIVNMPPDEYGDIGMLACNGWKYHWQKDILRREVKDGSPIAGIWGDEASLWISDFDSDFLSRCRSYRGFQVYICQSLANYEKCLPPDKAEVVVESLLSNFSHKIFFALGDYKTAEWAANLCGKEHQIFGGGSVQQAGGLGLFDGGEQHSSSFHEQYEHMVRPENFMTGMRTGSPVNDYKVDGLLIRAGVPFSNGLPALYVTFDQRVS